MDKILMQMICKINDTIKCQECGIWFVPEGGSVICNKCDNGQQQSKLE